MAELSAAQRTDHGGGPPTGTGPDVGRPGIEVVADADPVVVHDGPTIEEGVEVEVLSGFSHRWVPGFTVVEAAEGGYRLRRVSDRAVLPTWFGADEVRTPVH